MVGNCFAVDFYSRGSTMINLNGEIKFIPCPVWDWDGIIADCAKDGMYPNDYMISFNCVPRCGKWSGDRPDIGAFEYVPGQTSEKPWGDYKGWPMDYVTKQHLNSIKKFGVK